MGGTDLVTGHSVGLEIGGALVEFPAIPEADAVHHQVVVQMVGVYVGGHQHLETWKLPLGQLQADGVGLLGCQVIRLRKRLDEVVVLPPVRFSESLLGELHLGEGGLGGAVPAAHQSLPLPQRFFVLLGVPQHAAQRAPASASVFDCSESSYIRSPLAGASGAVH